MIQIPCYNEETQIENTIKEIKKSINPDKYNYQIIIIDYGSSDKTISSSYVFALTLVLSFLIKSFVFYKNSDFK